MYHAESNRGFTLIEMIVYVAILALVSAVSVQLILSLNDMIAKYRAQQLVFRSASTALERVLYDVRDAQYVFASSYTAPGYLTLSGGSATMAYSTSSDALHVTQAGVDLGPLTEDGVVVEELRFYEYSDVTDMVRVKMTLSATVGKSTVTRTFYAGGVLRGSYGM